MPAATRDIKRRIRSVTSTKKITKAMELVASAKMRKVAQAVVASRPYTDRAWEMLINLATRTNPDWHPLLRGRAEVKTIGIVLMTTNRGLVGALNTNLIARTKQIIADVRTATGAEVKIILLGTKGRAIMTPDTSVAADFPKDDIVTDVRQIQPLASMVIDGFLDATYDQILVAYSDFVSTLVQKPRIKQILPLSATAFRHGEEGIVTGQERQDILQEEAKEERQFEYLFEPNPDNVLDHLLPRLVTTQLYRALLEANASEQAAQMMAMKNASDAASDLIDDLTLTFNQARQAAITQDLAEISAGRAALES